MNDRVSESLFAIEYIANYVRCTSARGLFDMKLSVFGLEWAVAA